jgi:hypothetical protein
VVEYLCHGGDITLLHDVQEFPELVHDLALGSQRKEKA